MITLINLEDRQKWEAERRKRIGGSDAAAIMGMGYISNTELWEIKTGRREQKDISGLDVVRYGVEAEPLLRDLFRLDFPEYAVKYDGNAMYINDEYPFAHASLDGLLWDDDGRKGILEIKTANITNSIQSAKWKDRIPDNYYCQILWYMGVMEADFAILKAQLKYDYEELRVVTKHYHIEREEVKEDIKLILAEGERFYRYIKEDERPPLEIKM